MSSRLLGRTSNTACGRCRQKKKKCDQKLPKCKLCEAAGAICYAYDPLTKRPVPRSYVHDLEERVAELQTKLSQLERSMPAPGVLQPQNAGFSQTPVPSTRKKTTDADSAAATILSLETSTERSGAGFSKMLLRRLENSRTICAPSASTGLSPSRPSGSPTTLNDTDASLLSLDPVSMPPLDAARGLFDAYFQFANLCMPLLHEKIFDCKVQLLYNMPRTIDLSTSHSSVEAKLAVFFVLEVMAIGLLFKHIKEPLTSPLYLAKRYHDVAASALDAAGVPSTVEGAQALILFAQYLYHYPAFAGVWSAVGAALRFAVDLSLHQEPRHDIDADPLTVDTMRRTFWVAYMLDRNVSRSLGRPMFLPDGAISVKLPSAIRDEFITTDATSTNVVHTSASKLIALHLIRFRHIQSEMQTVLHDRPSSPYKPVNLHLWQQEMRLRLDGWFNSVPALRSAVGTEKTVIETIELTYKVGLVDLYRSTPNIPTPTESQHLEAATAAVDVIKLYRCFLSEHKLTIYWLAVQCLYAAGDTLLSGYVNTPAFRERFSFRDLQALVQTCSSTLWGLVEHFPAGVGKRDAFDVLSTEILADLGKRSMVLDGREDVNLEDDQRISGCASGNLIGHGRPSLSVNAGPSSLLDQQQASLLLSLSTTRPSHQPGIPDLVGTDNESRIQSQEFFRASWEPDSMAHIFASGPSLVPYDIPEDLSMIWEESDGFGATFNPTWV